MGLILLVYLILITTTVINIIAITVPKQNELNRVQKSLLERVFYPRSKTHSTTNHHSTELQNSFGVSGNVGIGFHFGSGYRIKNGDGKEDQEIVHNKMYDKYLGTSFGFGSLGNNKKGHIENVEQSVTADQNTIYHDEVNSIDQESDSEIIPTTTATPKIGVFRKISNYWTGEQSEPKSNYTSIGIFKWSMQNLKNKNNVGTPR
ncbi:uncharacterized protein LOC103308518 [Acyrthosiphon pisum]|uniref:Uncharacterized protein n=1 Tax=Acyrthosiphon pisum TaxID=7029 RepID=A0A8R2B3N0_ACYPI|nr:uncharacterized protein LOC103308518 [Acyrthosiphon pisum]|eukprot:XP_008180227.1 PREDICTED: uncharacterized protein LOC103308518 [Acyrthosiphon pisum]